MPVQNILSFRSKDELHRLYDECKNIFVLLLEELLKELKKRGER